MEVNDQLHAPAGHFNHGKRTRPRNHWIGGWMEPRTGLDAVAEKNPCPCRESNPGRSARSLVSILAEIFGSKLDIKTKLRVNN